MNTSEILLTIAVMLLSLALIFVLVKLLDFNKDLFSLRVFMIDHFAEIQSKNNNGAKYEIKKRSDGEYMFNLIAPNGKIIATSEGYKTRQSCLNGIESVQCNASTTSIDVE